MISTDLSDFADLLATKARGGAAPRETFGDSNVAFGWAEGLPPIVARFTDSATVDGLTFTATRVLPTATPATVVPERGVKPTAIQLETEVVSLKKYAGLAQFSLEAALSTTALVPALSASLVQQALVAYDADCVAALGADNGSTATGATPTEAILNGIAEVASDGQNPSVLILAPSDYAATVQDPGSAFSMDPASGITSLFGLAIAVCVGATAGTSYVIDSRAAVAVQNVQSPLVLLDPYSLADTNQARLVVDLAAGFVVTQPAGVCEVTVTPPGTQSDYALGA